MPNPYQSPGSASQEPNIRSLVQGPAVALIVVALIAIICGSLSLVVDAALVATGAVAELEEVDNGPISSETKIIVRSIWGIVLLIASAFVLYGAIQMRSQNNYRAARAAAVVAMVPCIGPCCILGIPFGIWAFVVLTKPGVRETFWK